MKLINTGPIENLTFDCKFENGKPCPIIFVGPNGCGKSIAISHVLNAIFEGQSSLYRDSEIPREEHFKIRNNRFIRLGTEYSLHELEFSDNFFATEILKWYPEVQIPHNILDSLKNPSIDEMNFDKMYHRVSHFSNNTENRLFNEFESSTILYFPPNRFEFPNWQNISDSKISSTLNFKNPKRNFYNRAITVTSPMNNNKNWFLNLLYDKLSLENLSLKLNTNSLPQELPSNLARTTRIVSEIDKFVKALFNIEGELEWKVGNRNSRNVGFSINGEDTVIDLFSLSTGQILMLDIFMTIIKDRDFVLSSPQAINKYEGIVIIEDIDLHLHIEHQYELLPKLIEFFPEIQFIVTSHSPFFLMGMSEKYSNNQFQAQIIDVKKGLEIESDQFNEIETTFNYFKNAKIFNQYTESIKSSDKKIIVFVEGIIDVQYIQHAARVLNEVELMNNIEIIELKGVGNLNSLWNTWKNSPTDWIGSKVILLFDCEYKISDENSNNIFVRKIPIQESPIKIGIENLFTTKTVDKIKEIDAKYFNEIRITHIDGGKEKTIEKSNVVKHEKFNLCRWLCENGNSEDFKNFSYIFDIFREVANLENK